MTYSQPNPLHTISCTVPCAINITINVTNLIELTPGPGPPGIISNLLPAHTSIGVAAGDILS